MTELTTPPGGSPFDAIKRTTPNGPDYWSARDLMPLLGYDKWERFSDAVGRASLSARAQGHNVDEAFSRTREEGTGGRPREDFHLSRFAAYLVAMNGDPRKPEVAAAQSYFAIRTREAEVAERPKSIEEMTLAVVQHLTSTVDDQHRQIENMKPLAARAMTYQAHATDQTRQEFAREIVKALREQLDVEATQRDVFVFLARKLRIFIAKGRSDSGHASAHGEREGLAVTDKGTTVDGYNYATGKLTPKGQAYAWKRIFAHAEQHHTIKITEEIAA